MIFKIMEESANHGEYLRISQQLMEGEHARVFPSVCHSAAIVFCSVLYLPSHRGDKATRIQFVSVYTTFLHY